MTVEARMHADGRLETAKPIFEIPNDLIGGRNLIPKATSPRWVENHTVVGDYEVSADKDKVRLSFVTIDVRPNTTYVISADSDFYTAMFTEDSSGAIGSSYSAFPKVVTTVDHTRVRIYVRSDSNYGTYLRNLKVEEGTVATPWSPMPDDLGYTIPDWIRNFDNPVQWHAEGVAVKGLIEGQPIGFDSAGMKVMELTEGVEF